MNKTVHAGQQIEPEAFVESDRVAWWLTFAGAALISLERVGSIPVVGSPGRVGLAILLIAATRVPTEQRALSLRRIGLGLIYLFGSGVALAQPGVPLNAWIAALATGVQFLVIYGIAVRIALRRDLLRAASVGIITSATLVALGIFQSRLAGRIAAESYFPGQSVDFYAQTQQRYTFGGVDPNFAGFTVALGLVALIAIQSRIPMTVRLALAAVLGWALILTGSRGAAVAALAGLVGSFLFQAGTHPRRVAAATAIATAILVLFLSGMMSSTPLGSRSSDGLSGRIDVIELTVGPWIDEGFFGTGRIDLQPDYDSANDRTRVHGSPFSIPIERGIIATIALVAMIYGDIRQPGAFGRKKREIIAMVATVAVTSLTLNVEEVRATWLIVGLYAGPLLATRPGTPLAQVDAGEARKAAP